MQSLRKLIILVIPVLVLVYGQGTSGSSGGNKQVEKKDELIQELRMRIRDMLIISEQHRDILGAEIGKRKALEKEK